MFDIRQPVKSLPGLTRPNISSQIHTASNDAFVIFGVDFSSSVIALVMKRMLPVLSSFLAALVLFASASSAQAFDLVGATHLLELRQGSRLSQKVGGVRGLSYESAHGRTISMADWYETDWVDVHFAFLTQLNRQFGVIWGLSTGERGEKYRIAPSLKLGFVYSVSLGRAARFSIRAHRIFSGRLTEKSCTADYGDIGGIREVNCRLAASVLQPEETLRFNFDEKPMDRNFVAIEFRKEF